MAVDKNGKPLPPGIRQRANGKYEGRVQYEFDRYSVYADTLKVLDKGIIKQLKTQGSTYNQTPPLETMGGVFAYMGKLRWTTYGQGGIVLSMAIPRTLLDILSRGGGFGEQPQQAFLRPLRGGKNRKCYTPALLAGSVSHGNHAKQTTMQVFA